MALDAGSPRTLLVTVMTMSLFQRFPSGSPSLRAEEPSTPVSREEHEKVLEELEKLRRDLEELKQRGLEPRAEEPAEGETGRLPGYADGVYDKPFLGRLGAETRVGGYFDVEFRDARNQAHDFRFHRFVPFFYADLHERLRFASEVEIEDGSEVEVEFAHLDFSLIRQANFRGGVILDPLGKFNLIHDSPINELTDRPLVDEFVIPTTLREIGVGLFGTLTPREALWDVKYEAYLTSGFKGLADDGTGAITRTEGLHDARPHEEALGTRHFGDNNNSFAGVGRLSLSPFLGTELGVSAHHGAYDESGDNDLSIAAVDALVTVPEFRLAGVPVGQMQLQGEGAYAFIERDGLARAAGIPDDFWGYYGQVSYHFMPAFLTENVPALFLPGSTFTLVGRWDQTDIDGDRRRRVTIGLNYRPVMAVAIKFDYQFNRATGSAPRSAEDDAFLVSLASYF